MSFVIIKVESFAHAIGLNLSPEEAETAYWVVSYNGKTYPCWTWADVSKHLLAFEPNFLPKIEQVPEVEQEGSTLPHP